jgi:hypothetical protein
MTQATKLACSLQQQHSYNADAGSSYSAQQKGWGNQELQCYSASYENVNVIRNPDNPDDGALHSVT